MRAVFLDRDGTIIEDAHYIRDPKDVRCLPNAVDGLKALRRQGFPLFVVSNQSGVGRGILTTAQFWAVHQRVCEVLQAAGVDIAEFGYCFHHPDDACQCRKPRSGLVPAQYQGQALDWKRSFVVGDSPADMGLADTIGSQGLLVLTGKGIETRRVEPQRPAFTDLLKVAEYLADK